MRLLFIILLFPLISNATIKIAVLDTGLPYNHLKLKICEAHDFTDTIVEDMQGHGTNVSNIIEAYAGPNADYCQVILKVFGTGIKDSLKSTMEALEFVKNRDDIQIINYSGGGSLYSKKEKNLIMKLLQKKKLLVVAAGNDGTNLDKYCVYYPACYSDKLIVVGNGLNNKEHAITSNYGKYIKQWINGNNICTETICMSGTSQSTAIISGMIIHKSLSSKKRIPASNYDEAMQVTVEQMYYYNKINFMVQNQIDKYKEQVPEFYKQPVEHIVPIIDILVHQRISFRKEF